MRTRRAPIPRAEASTGPPSNLPGMFFCICCGVEREESKRSVEHPLPRATGGHGWSVSDVCTECNRYCGKEVDHPFVSHVLIRQLRHRFEIPDAGGQVPSAPRLYGETSGGRRVELELSRDRPRTRRLPRIDCPLGTGASATSSSRARASAISQSALSVCVAERTAL
jgi:hypothetical protein